MSLTIVNLVSLAPPFLLTELTPAPAGDDGQVCGVIRVVPSVVGMFTATPSVVGRVAVVPSVVGTVKAGC